MRVLVISPHPDDEAIGCGGTVYKHGVDGDEVRVLYLTSGEKGGHGLDEILTGKLRECEAQKAALILGVEHLEFWNEPDGGLRASRKLMDRLANSINAWSADRIYVPHIAESHSDHRAAVRLLRGAIAQCNKTPQVFMYEVWTPLEQMDLIVDISPFIETKLEAIRSYESQCRVLKFDKAMHGLASYRGELFVWPKTEEHAIACFAEVFQVLVP